MSDLSNILKDLDALDHGFNGTTKGNFKTEREAEDFVFHSSAVNKWFFVYRQTPARPAYQHPAKTELKDNYRIDIFLIPRQEIQDMGWKDGAIAIEVKRSNEKIGPAFSQAFDYTNSLAYLPGGVLIQPSWAFVFPSKTEGGPVASLQAQNRFGCAYADHLGEWEFYSGHTKVCTFNEMRFDLGKQKVGNKTGSR